MVVKVYISGISGNKEVKKRQQRVLMILESKNIKHEVLDIAEPGNEEHKDFMQNNSTSLGATVSDTTPRHPLPPQLFNETDYCGDYDQFDMANEIDELEKFLKVAVDDSVIVTSSAEIKLGNGNESMENDKDAEQISSTAVEEEEDRHVEVSKETNGEAENGANEANEAVTDQNS